MRKAIMAAVVALASAVPAYAQSTVAPPPTGGTESIIRTPSANGGSSGVSGSVGSPTSVYPGRLRDYNNPSVNYGTQFRNLGIQRRK
jgi:opacity protein-like surface antigen